MAIVTGTVLDFDPSDVDTEYHPNAWLFVDSFRFEHYNDAEARCFVADTRDPERILFDVRGTTDFAAVVEEYHGKPVWGLYIYEIGGNGRLRVHLTAS